MHKQRRPKVLEGPGATRAFAHQVLVRAIRLKADRGISISRNLPTVRQLRERGLVPANVRTYAQAADYLERAA